VVGRGSEKTVQHATLVFTMSTFEQYNEEYLSLVEQITTNFRILDNYTANATNNEDDVDINLVMKTIQSLLPQADDLLKQMSLEARLQREAETENIDIVKLYKIQLVNLRNVYNTAVLTTGAKGCKGFNDTHTPSTAITNNTTTTALLVEKQNSTLSNVQSIINNTESVAADTITELSRQRETILKSQSHVTEITSLTKTAQQIIHSMMERKQRWFG
jgi:hypothetical protein